MKYAETLTQRGKNQNAIRKKLEGNGHICMRNSGYAFDVIIDW